MFTVGTRVVSTREMDGHPAGTQYLVTHVSRTYVATLRFSTYTLLRLDADGLVVGQPIQAENLHLYAKAVR